MICGLAAPGDGSIIAADERVDRVTLGRVPAGDVRFVCQFRALHPMFPAQANVELPLRLP